MEFRWCTQRIPGTRHRADIRTWRFPCRTSPASGGRQSIAMGRMRITAKLRAPQRRRRRAGWAHGGVSGCNDSARAVEFDYVPAVPGPGRGHAGKNNCGKDEADHLSSPVRAKSMQAT